MLCMLLSETSTTNLSWSVVKTSTFSGRTLMVHICPQESCSGSFVGFQLQQLLDQRKHSIFIGILCTAECVSIRRAVSWEQPPDSHSVEFSRSYLTCQQSEDLADQMCLCIKASGCMGTSVCLWSVFVWKPCKCVITWLICSLINRNIEHSWSVGVKEFQDQLWYWGSVFVTE